MRFFVESRPSTREISHGRLKSATASSQLAQLVKCCRWQKPHGPRIIPGGQPRGAPVSERRIAPRGPRLSRQPPYGPRRSPKPQPPRTSVIEASPAESEATGSAWAAPPASITLWTQARSWLASSSGQLLALRSTCPPGQDALCALGN